MSTSPSLCNAGGLERHLLHEAYWLSNSSWSDNSGPRYNFIQTSSDRRFSDVIFGSAQAIYCLRFCAATRPEKTCAVRLIRWEVPI